MSDEPALLAAILAQPEEDTPRLVYADWLQEQGQEERAEFIRVQIRLTRKPRAAGRRRVHALLRDSRFKLVGADLFGAMFEEQKGRFDGRFLCGTRPHDGSCRIRFARGFIEEVSCPAETWLCSGDAILAAHPVTTVRLTTVPRVEFEMDRTRGLAGDPQDRMWYEEEIAVATAALGPMRHLLPVDHVESLAALTLRWPRVTFTLPEGTP